MSGINFLTSVLFRFSTRNQWEAYRRTRKRKDVVGSSEIILSGIKRIEKFLKKQKNVDVVYELSKEYEMTVPFDTMLDQLDVLTTSLMNFRDAVRMNDVAEMEKELRKINQAHSTSGSKTMKAVDYFSYNDRYALVQAATVFTRLVEHWVNLLVYTASTKHPDELMKVVQSITFIQRRITSIYIWFEILVGMSCGLNPAEIGAQYGDE